MPVITNPQDYNAEDVYVDLGPTFGHRLYLKCEGFNFAGSIKLKAAAEMVTAAERGGVLRAGSILVESSSGNLGVALSIIAANRGYEFVCVTDERSNQTNRSMIEALGGQVHVVTTPEPDSGFLGARISHVRQLCASSDRYVWLNQYANPGNWRAHYRRTARAIDAEFPDLDVLFVGAGTTGTLMGCARYFRDHRPSVTVVAVDVVGSVTFGGPAEPRMIPGLGTSVRPQLLDQRYVDDVVHVSEPDAIVACHTLVRRGFLFGGSTGSVVCGADRWLRKYRPDGTSRAVAIAPDLGERYLGSIYRESWIREHYGVGPYPFEDAEDDSLVLPENGSDNELKCPTDIVGFVR